MKSRLSRLVLSALSRCIARLDTSNKRGAATRLVRNGLLRMRALMLMLANSRPHNRQIFRALLLLLDPVSAGLWPHLRRRAGLNRRQRFARWLVSRANPQAVELLPEGDCRSILEALREIYPQQLGFGRQNLRIPRVNDSGSPVPDEARFEIPYRIGGNTTSVMDSLGWFGPKNRTNLSIPLAYRLLGISAI